MASVNRANSLSWGFIGFLCKSKNISLFLSSIFLSTTFFPYLPLNHSFRGCHHTSDTLDLTGAVPRYSQTIGTLCFALLKRSVTTLWEAQATWKVHVDARINSPSWVKPSIHPGEGNGNPLKYSCLENLMDRGA